MRDKTREICKRGGKRDKEKRRNMQKEREICSESGAAKQ
jgi:hypothetical protein